MNSQIIRDDCKKLVKSFDSVQDIFNKTFLITGSNGLFGNYLVNILSVVNELYDSNIKAYCISKHAPVWRDNNFSYTSQDLSRPFSFNSHVDYIIHCACYARPKIFLANELETVALNVDATRTLLDIARKNEAKFLFLSSSEIYGSPPPSQIPTKESYPGNSLTSSGRAAYVEAKRLGEALCFIYHRTFQTDAKAARIGPTYGPGISIHDERVMGSFMKQAIIDKHIKLMDEGKALRTWCYITDALNIMLKMMLHGKETLYNVGGIETVSIYEMAQMIARYSGATCEAGSGTGMKDAPDIVKLDVSKARNEFGIGKFIPFQEGLKRTIDWNLQRGKV